MNVIQSFRRWVWFNALVLAVLPFSGCHSDPVFTDLLEPGTSGAPAGNMDPGSVEFFHAGDELNVVLSDLPGGSVGFTEPIPEAGTITLLLNQKFVALRKTRSAMEQELRTRYGPQHFCNMSVNIKATARNFSVGAEG